MVYKIGNVSDLERIPIPDSNTYDLLYRYARILSDEYGEERNVDTDDGGYVLYTLPCATSEDIKAFFDYTKHTVESVDRFGYLCAATYILHNEFVVTIVMSTNDLPNELIKDLD